MVDENFKAMGREGGKFFGRKDSNVFAKKSSRRGKLGAAFTYLSRNGTPRWLCVGAKKIEVFS